MKIDLSLDDAARAGVNLDKLLGDVTVTKIRLLHYGVATYSDSEIIAFVTVENNTNKEQTSELSLGFENRDETLWTKTILAQPGTWEHEIRLLVPETPDIVTRIWCRRSGTKIGAVFTDPLLLFPKTVGRDSLVVINSPGQIEVSDYTGRIHKAHGQGFFRIPGGLGQKILITLEHNGKLVDKYTVRTSNWSYYQFRPSGPIDGDWRVDRVDAVKEQRDNRIIVMTDLKAPAKGFEHGKAYTTLPSHV